MTAVLSWRRVLTTGSAVAVLVLVLGGAAELVLIGRTDAVARARAERAIQAHVDSVDASLTSVARRLAERLDVRAGITGDLEEALLFLRVEAEAQSVPDLSITIYDARGVPRAWSGRPAEHGRDRVQAGPAGFAETDQAGLRLVHVEPIVDPGDAVSGGRARRLGSVVTERVLSPAALDLEPDRRFGLETAVGRATVRAVEAGTRTDTDTDPDRITVIGSDGRPLIDAAIGLEEIAKTRARLRARVWAFLLRGPGKSRRCRSVVSRWLGGLAPTTSGRSPFSRWSRSPVAHGSGSRARLACSNCRCCRRRPTGRSAGRG